MMKIKKSTHSLSKNILLGIFTIFSISLSFAQNVGINGDGSTPNSSAGLDIKFTDKGLLIPRVAINNLNSASPITTPAEGLLVYNETGSVAKGFYYWNGSKWILLSTVAAGSGWSLTGNTGTVEGTNFMGTTDNVSLDFRINNRKAGHIGKPNDASVYIGYEAGNEDDLSDNQNTGVGYKALFRNTIGQNNSAYGFHALYSNTTGNYNVANGYQALYSNTTGESNVASGYLALYSNTTGAFNIASGYLALYSNTTGAFNIASGYLALFSNTTGIRNVASGYQALHRNTTGESNIASGYQALAYNTTGDYNIASGYQALAYNTAGHHNIASGFNALYSNTTGSHNIASGYTALKSNTTGNHNVAIGSSALNSNTTGYNNIASGYSALHNNTIGINNIASGINALYDNTGSNNIGIGYNAQTPTAAASNQVRIGNTAVTYAGIQVAWTITSDLRWKTDIQNTPLGLSFINTLRPVVYVRKNDDKKRPEYGFIAQEIETALQNAGVNPEGIITKDDEGMYGVRYNDFIAPMVKSIQELSVENEALKAKNVELEKRLERIESLIK